MYCEQSLLLCYIHSYKFCKRIGRKFFRAILLLSYQYVRPEINSYMLNPDLHQVFQFDFLLICPSSKL